MGYGASSKGGGGSGSAGGGKKKSGRGGKPKTRHFKVKKKAAASAASSSSSSPPPPPAFTVREPNPEHRARLLESRRRGERAASARKESQSKPVNGTGTRGRMLGSGGGDDATANAASGDRRRQQQRPQGEQQARIEREARLALFAEREADAGEAARPEPPDPPRFGPQTALARRHLDALVERTGGREGSSSAVADVRRLLEVVLRNAATKSDAKYRVLRAANDRLWTGLLRFPEAVALLVDAAGFERRGGGAERVVEATAAEGGAEANATRFETERDRLQPKVSLASDDSSSTELDGPCVIASLVADLEGVAIAPTNQKEDEVEKVRDFELYHAGGDGLGLERMLAVLQAINTW